MMAFESKNEVLSPIFLFGDYFNIEIKETTVTKFINVIYFFVNIPLFLFSLILIMTTRITKDAVTNINVLRAFKVLFLVFLALNFLIVVPVIFLLFTWLGLLFKIVISLIALVLYFLFYIVFMSYKIKSPKTTYIALAEQVQVEINEILEAKSDFNAQRIKVEALLTIKKFFESSAKRKVSVLGVVTVLFLKTKLVYGANLEIIEKETNQALKIMPFE